MFGAAGGRPWLARRAIRPRPMPASRTEHLTSALLAEFEVSVLRGSHSENIGLGDNDGPKPYKFTWLGDTDGPKPHKFMWFGANDMTEMPDLHQTKY